MTDFETIESAEVPGWPFVFIVGSLDSRITFFSQQVRGFNLIDALVATNHLKDRWKFAVVGAGAAGLATSTALGLLIPNAQIHLFERNSKALYLQHGCTRRNLHPHIYDWPKADASNNFANLPVLDWEAGTADSVATSVAQSFEIVRAILGKPELKFLKAVTSITRTGDAYQVTYQAAPPGSMGSEAYDAVFLTMGFGNERELPGIGCRSYWSDAGVPENPKIYRGNTRMLVSGAGDGGLIDLAAAALQDFDHQSLILLVSNYPGIEGIADDLLAIEREAGAHGANYDFLVAYESRVGQHVHRIGLVAAIAEKLHPRRALIFNTEDIYPLKSQTSVLNRLVVYLLIRATESIGSRIDHRPGRLSASAPLVLGQYAIDGVAVSADEIVVRHGAATEDAFAGFAEIFTAYAQFHTQWLALDPARAVPPSLNDTARWRLEQALDRKHFPVPRALHTATAARTPSRVKLEVDSATGEIIWSGQVQPPSVIEWWNQPTGMLIIECQQSPTVLGGLASAVARLLIHGRHVNLETGDAAWSTWLAYLTEGSRHAQSLDRPIIGSIQPMALTSTRFDAETTAEGLHHAFDLWVLDTADAHLLQYFTVGSTAANRIAWPVEPLLRSRMRELWRLWYQELRIDPALLRRLLRLMACALEDNIGNPVDRLVLCGPHKFTNTLSTIAMALAAGVAWNGGAPRKSAPGNVDRCDDHGDSTATVHACGAELIDGKLIGLRAYNHEWKTDYALLSQVATPAYFERKAAASLRDVHHTVPRLDEDSLACKVIISADRDFLLALAGGVAPIVEHFRRTEDEIRSQWASQIDTGGSAP